MRCEKLISWMPVEVEMKEYRWRIIGCLKQYFPERQVETTVIEMATLFVIAVEQNNRGPGRIQNYWIP